MIKSFRDVHLEQFFRTGKATRYIPAHVTSALARKLDILDAAVAEDDLRIPPGNRFEHLKGNLCPLCSIRVNKQYRLIFKWHDSQAFDIHLDPHTYR